MKKEQIIIFKSIIGNIIVKSDKNKNIKNKYYNKKTHNSKNNLLINAKKEILEYLSKKENYFLFHSL